MQNRKGAARWRRRLPVQQAAAVCLFTFRDPKIAAEGADVSNTTWGSVRLHAFWAPIKTCKLPNLLTD